MNISSIATIMIIFSIVITITLIAIAIIIGISSTTLRIIPISTIITSIKPTITTITIKVWSEDGVRRSSRFEDADEFVCLTSHLTIFGAVLEAVLQVLQCSTASEVLSVDGLQNLGNAQWLHYAASIVTFVSLSFFAGAMIWAMRRDCRTAEDLPFEEVAEALLVSRREVESSGLEPHVEEVEGLEPDAQAAANRRCCPRCRACAMKGLDGAVWLLSTMFEVQATDSVSELLDVKMAMVNRCITSILDGH